MAEGVVGVGVVDHHVEVLPAVDALHAPGHRRKMGDPLQHRLHGQSLGKSDGQRRQEIAHIVAAEQGRAHRGRASGPGQIEGGVVRMQPHPRRAQVGLAVDPESQDLGRRRHFSGQPPSVAAVEIDHRLLRDASVLPDEQAALRFIVGLHRPVVVDVVLGEVQENRDFDVQTVGPLLVDAVGADLHDRIRAAVVPHLGEQGVDVDRLRRGAERGQRAAADVVADRPDQPDLVAAPGEVLREHRDRGLPVRAGDAGDVEGLVRATVEAPRHLGQGPADVGHLDEIDRKVRAEILLRDDGHGPPVDRLLDEVVSVGAETADGEKQGAGHHAAAVRDETGHLPVGPELFPTGVEPLDEFGEARIEAALVRAAPALAVEAARVGGLTGTGGGEQRANLKFGETDHRGSFPVR